MSRALVLIAFVSLLAAGVFVLVMMREPEAAPGGDGPVLASVPAIGEAPSYPDPLTGGVEPDASRAESVGVGAETGAEPAAAAPVGEGAPEPFVTGPRGTLRGRVLLNSNPPPVEPIDRSSDPYFADSQPMYDESLLLGPDTAMQNAVVSLLGESGPVPPLPTSVEVHIVDGRFVPRIALVPVSATLHIVNDDDTTYELRGHSDPGEDVAPNPEFSRVLEGRGSSLTHVFTHTEPGFSMSCARHDWMLGWVAVIDHPWYAVTDGMGRYEMHDVPAGAHVVQVWHETMGTRETEVFVSEGKDADASFTFGRGRR